MKTIFTGLVVGFVCLGALCGAAAEEDTAAGSIQSADKPAFHLLSKELDDALTCVEHDGFLQINGHTTTVKWPGRSPNQTPER